MVLFLEISTLSDLAKYDLKQLLPFHFNEKVTPKKCHRIDHAKQKSYETHIQTVHQIIPGVVLLCFAHLLQKRRQGS